MPPGACVSENCLDPPAGSRGSGAKKGSESGMTTTTKPMRGSAPNYDEILRVVHVVISMPGQAVLRPRGFLPGWTAGRPHRVPCRRVGSISRLWCRPARRRRKDSLTRRRGRLVRQRDPSVQLRTASPPGWLATAPDLEAQDGPRSGRDLRWPFSTAVKSRRAGFAGVPSCQAAWV